MYLYSDYDVCIYILEERPTLLSSFLPRYKYTDKKSKGRETMGVRPGAQLEVTSKY